MSSEADGSSQNLFAKRRNLVKSMALGGGVVTGLALLPKEWTKPIVEIAHLPAHAATSPPATTTPTPTSTAGTPTSTPTPTDTPAPTPTDTPTPTPTNTPIPP